MQKGKVKWFNKTKGYGFIINDADGKDYFVHYKNINMKGFKNLDNDAVVTFDIEEQSDGKVQAINVTTVNETVEK